jgi:hypothetical protein
MSSLVDYGSSGESENESVNDDGSKPVLESELPFLKEVEKKEHTRPESDEKYSELDLLSSLPPPKTTEPVFILNADDDGLIVNSHRHFQKKQLVKITIPSLSEVNGISMGKFSFLHACIHTTYLLHSMDPQVR